MTEDTSRYTHRTRPRASAEAPALGLATVDVLGLPVVRAGGDAVLAAISSALAAERPLRIAYVNAHTATLASTNPEFHVCLRECDLLLNDGSGVALAAKWSGRPVSENLNGSDFTVRLLHLISARGQRVFLFGARPGVAVRAADKLRDLVPGLEIVGVSHGYRETSAVVGEIRDARAEVVVVALGNPLQELWLRDHLTATGALCGVSVGAFLDFTAGRVRRAPPWANRYGIEWVFRLVREPRRLARRYMVGGPVFVWRVAYRLMGQRFLGIGRSRRQ
jgi:exopolysaccharide biosynthesis WecB/TagA/CpsF family protein